MSPDLVALDALARLQWGRRANAAECWSLACTAYAMPVALQWGRRANAAECDVGAFLEQLALLLQWGRRANAAE